MWGYIAQRIGLFVPTLLFITLLSFALSRLAPGDPAALKVGVGAEGGIAGRTGLNERTLELLRKQWHLDKPLWQQYLLWLRDLVTLEFGRSFQDNRPVLEKIAERLPITLAMNLFAVLIAYGIAIPLGVYSATHSGTALDRFLTFLLFALYSLPSFWVAMLAVTFLCNPEYLALFPTGGIRSIFHSEHGRCGSGLWTTPGILRYRCWCTRTQALPSSPVRCEAPCWRCYARITSAPPTPRGCPGGW
jgi:peptide/nickel transport system permease protein